MVRMNSGLTAASTFLAGAMAISASQILAAPLKFLDAQFYDSYMAWTKESFAVLMATITQWWAPTVIHVTGDESVQGQIFQMDDGSLKCNFPHRLIVMANHQLYTDWMYLWWIAYTNKMHGRIYIVLKESLKNLPIIGWGAQFYEFIFLSRKWRTDRGRFSNAFEHLQDPNHPMWLLIFPEGTNLSASARQKSCSWGRKNGIPDMKHQLLPRIVGLQFCLRELRRTSNWLYDCTIAYEGIPEGDYGQNIFTLRSSLFEGKPPKSVNMFWRRFKISDVPVDNDEAFTRWITNRWREKDYLLEYFAKYQRFPAVKPAAALAIVENRLLPKHAKDITTHVKAGGLSELLGIFGAISAAQKAFTDVEPVAIINHTMMNTNPHRLLGDHLRRAKCGSHISETTTNTHCKSTSSDAERHHADKFAGEKKAAMSHRAMLSPGKTSKEPPGARSSRLSRDTASSYRAIASAATAAKPSPRKETRSKIKAAAIKSDRSRSNRNDRDGQVVARTGQPGFLDLRGSGVTCERV